MTPDVDHIVNIPDVMFGTKIKWTFFLKDKFFLTDGRKKSNSKLTWN